MEEESYGGKPILEWISNSESDSGDSDWAVISPVGSPNVSFSNSNAGDAVSITHIKKNISPYSLQLEAKLYFKINDDGRKLEVLKKNEEIIATFTFLESDHINFFSDVVCRYFSLREQERDPSLLLLQDKFQADIDDKLSALDLVPNRSPNNGRKRFARRYGDRSHHHHNHHWASEAPKKVWGFFHNMKRDPYTTTLSTLSKVYDVVLYGDYYEEAAPEREEGEEVTQLLQSISGFDDLEPGFEILTKKEDLAVRPVVERLGPLLHEEFKAYLDSEGRITDVRSLKERIFRGGLVPTLRGELWCYLLGVYDWNNTYKEREERRKLKENEYFIMKQQWKTFTETQERNFSGYRDRKSLIEKDVNRTDRNHPFYEGEVNSNLEMLNDILMTYIMYNFDLGYVQGMSDLVAPILYVIQNEAMTFWCFVGYMELVYRNFDLDQSGMKQQLSDLSQVLRVIDPELWEVLWTQHLCPNFHLLIAAAILDTEREEIIEQKLGFPEHVNSLALRIDLDAVLKKAEAIYIQLSNSSCLSNSLRAILNLPLVEQKAEATLSPSPDLLTKVGFPGKAERVTAADENKESVLGDVEVAVGTVHHLASVEARQNEEEIQFEKGVSHSFL
ncbi:TBC1 domain family member 15 [Armadillidium vulgare]|nr:TBC1 domain family member 15 [Armadillidium vulgare]